MQRVFSALLALVVSLAAHAQSISSSVSGIVRDASGAAVPAAQLTLKQVSTSLERKASSDARGRYNLPGLEAGLYDLTVSRDGFDLIRFEKLRINVSEVTAFDIVLKISSVKEVVSVSAEAEVLETQNATLSNLVDGRRVLDLPLNGRNFAQLINLQNGVAIVSSQGLLGGGPDSAGLQGSGMFVNGARGGANNFLFDGGDANDPVVPGGTGAASTSAFTGGAPGINAISVDAIAEFRVITSGASAEFGRSSGATINVITRSGSNDWHGSAFHFLRNRALNARSTIEPRKPPFVQNNFGGSLGGRLRRDRSFFFGNYEGFRQRQSVSNALRTPSANTIAAVRRQNALLGEILGAYFTGPAAPTPGTFTERSVEDILASGVPVVGATTLPRNNGVDQNTFAIKLDHIFSEATRLSGRYQFFDGLGQPGSVSGQGIAGSNVGYDNRSQNIVLNLTQSFGSNLLHEGRLVFQRNSPRTSFEPTSDALLNTGRLRTTGPFAGQPYGTPDTPNGLPSINPGFGISSVGYDTTAPNRRGVNTWQLADTWTRYSGAHTIKAGFEVRRIQENSVFSFRLRPDVLYQSGGANTILQPGAPMDSYDQNVYLNPDNAQRGFRLTEWAAFVQDNWRVHPTLTLDYGLRYEYYGRPSEVNGFLNNAYLSPNGVADENRSLLSMGIAGLRNIRLRTVGPGRPFSFYNADYNNFGPRIGLAWRPSDYPGTVVRASYGVFFDRMFNNVFGNARVSPPYTVPVNISGVPFGAAPAVNAFTTTLPIAPVVIDPNFRNAYTQRFQLGLQKEVGANMRFEIGYVGARAQRIIRTLRPNMGPAFGQDFRPMNAGAPDLPRSNDDFRPIVIGNMSMRDSGGASSYHSAQLSLQRRFSRGFSLQANYTLAQTTDIASGEILNDVVVTTWSNTLPLRTANGLVPTPTLANINQLRRSQNQAEFANTRDAGLWFVDNHLGPNQWRADIGNAAFDIRHVFVTNLSWELPFFAGQPGWKKRLFHGWQLNGVGRWQSGVPFNISSGVDVNGDGNAPDRAALIAGNLDSILEPGGGVNGNRRYLRSSTLISGANTPTRRVFADGTTIGVSPQPELVSSYLKRGALHGPPMRLIDLSLLRRIALRERLSLQLRAEAFNVANITNLGQPINTITSPLFGEIQGVATPPRQLQFGARLEW
jgi:outer membrane receptor protein involved in Fe transport